MRIRTEYEKRKRIRHLRRRQRKAQATPPWSDPEAMRDIYNHAEKLSTKIGILYTVDHVVPLLSKTVCGLHCEHNMNVIRADINNTKSNETWPDMW